MTSFRRLISAAILMSVAVTGCNAFPRIRGINDDDPTPRRWRYEWYETQKDAPVGARQVQKAGRLWPPFARPTGKQQQFTSSFHAAHYWPHPYNCADQAFVRDICELQAVNGWKLAATLYSHHFDNETNDLTQSGEIYLRWIVEEAAPYYQTVWVQRTGDTTTSQVRLDNVMASVAVMVGDSEVPPVRLRTTTEFGRPASMIEHIHQTFQDTMPEPRIPFQTLVGSSGSE